MSIKFKGVYRRFFTNKLPKERLNSPYDTEKISHFEISRYTTI